GGGEIAAERGAISNQRRRKQPEPTSDLFRGVEPARANVSERKRRADPDRVRARAELMQLVNRLHADQLSPSGSAKIGFDAEVRSAGDDLRRRRGSQQVDTLVHRTRSCKAGDLKRPQRWCRLRQSPYKWRVHRCTERVRRITNGSVASTTAQVSRQRHHIARRLASRPVLFSKEADGKAGRAVPALRSAMRHQRLL